MPLNANHYAILIGITDYDSLNKLPGAVQDAQELKEWLTDTKTGGGIPSENCLLFTTEADTLEPSFLNIYQQIIDLILKLKMEPSVKTRRLYFFFSGHGFGLDNDYEDVIICLSNWSDFYRNMGFEFKQLKNYIATAGVFSEMILLLDCCRSRKIKVSGLPMPNNIKPAANTPHSLTGYATQAYNPAFEAEISGGASIDTERLTIHGHFTRALLEVLENRPLLEQGVPADQVKSHVERRTPIFSAEAKNSPVQEAKVILDIPSAYDFFLGGTQKEKSIDLPAPVELLDFIIKADPFVELSIYDESGKEQYTGYEGKLLSLPAGTYTLIYKFGSNREKKEIEHPVSGNYTELAVNKPDLYSAAILSGAETTHEYYHNKVAEYSLNYTAAPVHQNVESAFFFMLRLSKSEFTQDQDIEKVQFQLLDHSLNVLLTFDKKNSKIDRGGGSFVCSMELLPGEYYLLYQGQSSRLIPVTVYPKWRTHIFITYHHRPLFEGMRVLLGKWDQRFNPNTMDHHLVDLATDLITQAPGELPPGLIKRLQEDFEDDPMLGIIGAYLLLRQKEPDLQLLRKVIDQTMYLLPVNSADINVIRLLASVHFPDLNQAFAFEYPPMLGFGLDKVIEQSLERSKLIPEGSIINSISPKLHRDGPFVSWQFDLSKYVERTAKEGLPPADMGEKAMAKKWISRSFESASDFLVEKEEEREPIFDWVFPAIVLNAKMMNVKELGTKSLARQMRLPEATIREVLAPYAYKGVSTQDLQSYILARAGDLYLDKAKLKKLLKIGKGKA